MGVRQRVLSFLLSERQSGRIILLLRLSTFFEILPLQEKRHGQQSLVVALWIYCSICTSPTSIHPSCSISDPPTSRNRVFPLPATRSWWKRWQMSTLTRWFSRTRCEGCGRSGLCFPSKLSMCHGLLYVLRHGKSSKRGISNGELVLYLICRLSAGSNLEVRGWWHIWGCMEIICYSICWLICLSFRGKQTLSSQNRPIYTHIWCRSSMLDEDTCFRALRSLHRLLTRFLNSAQISARISMYIEQIDSDHAREIFIRIVRRLILLSYAPFCSLLSSVI